MVTQTANVAVSTRDVEAYLRFRALVDLAQPPALAGLDDVQAAAGTLRAATARAGYELGTQHAPQMLSAGRVGIQTLEGRTFELLVSPGTAGLVCYDANRRERVDARSTRARQTRVDAMVLYGGEAPEGSPTREVYEWSGKSRARMFQTIPSLDFSGWNDGTLCMVTLTLPGWWEVAAATGRQWKRLVENLRRRWVRAGLEWVGLWKMEFQRRGAPHHHMLMRVPALVAGVAFEDWLSRTWADVVLDSLSDRDALAYIGLGEYDRHLSAGTGIDYSGSRYSDPRRIATYFLGHSAKSTDGKEYQHRVPALWQSAGAGPGRFWGYVGLDRAVERIDLEPAEFFALARVMRHVHRARAWKHAHQAAGYGLSIRRRPVRGFNSSGALTGGTVVVNDGVRLAHDLARCLRVWAS